jgi:hypothetical protein
LVYNWAFQRFLKRPMSLYAFYHVYGVASFWTCYGPNIHHVTPNVRCALFLHTFRNGKLRFVLNTKLLFIPLRMYPMRHLPLRTISLDNRTVNFMDSRKYFVANFSNTFFKVGCAINYRKF